MGPDDEAAMEKLVVAALAYYGLKVFHVFDGREFKASLKVIERDRQKALEEFSEVVSASGFELLDKFAEEFCRPDLLVSTPAARPTEVQSQLVPELVLKLVTPEIAEQGNKYSSSIKRSRIWSTLSTFMKDNSGHYVVPYRDGKPCTVQAKVSAPKDQLQREFHVEDLKTGIGKLNQNMNVKCAPANGMPFLPFSPTNEYSPLFDQADGGRQSPVRKREAAHNVESGDREPKRCKVQSVGEEIETPKQPGQWRENLAKEWPHIFQEIQEHVKSDPKETDVELSSECPHPARDLPALIELEMVDLNSMQEAPNLEGKRKRERGTDERASGGTLLNDSSLESLGRGKEQMSHTEMLEADFTTCAGEELKDVKSEAGSNRITLDADLDDTEHKRYKSSWPAPLYGDQIRAKSPLENLELGEEGDICTHELEGNALNSCPICTRKEEITFCKYTRLFNDDMTWKHKFLDGGNLTCDICSSKGKIAEFTDVTLLLSHARKGLELRGPEHRGYAEAIYNLMQLTEPGMMRTCLSAVGKTIPVKTKRVWPPVIVLENTFQASDRCLDLRNLDKEVTRRLSAFVNLGQHTLHKVMAHGSFEGTILVELPPTRRGLNDANRLHQHFLLTGRSLHDWIRLRNKRLALLRYPEGVQETSDLVKTGEKGEIQSRIYFGYIATVKIMTGLDAFRHLVKWRGREPKYVDDE